jgi:hypothetical protein
VVRGRLPFGAFPRDPIVAKAIEGPFDLVLAKNVFKHGSRPRWPPRPLASLGQVLAEGGILCVYNVGLTKPRRSRWSDARVPFDRRAWGRAGFELLADSVDDSETARAHAAALGWDRGPDALRLDGLVAHYSLARRLTSLSPPRPTTRAALTRGS